MHFTLYICLLGGHIMHRQGHAVVGLLPILHKCPPFELEPDLGEASVVAENPTAHS